MRWSEKLQALKVLKQATPFLKEHGELTQPARKKVLRPGSGFGPGRGDWEADEDWKDLLAAADGPAVEVVLVEDDGCLTGLFEHRGHGGAQGGDVLTTTGEAMSVQRQTGQWKDVEDMGKGREHNATHRDRLPSWATYAPARGRAHE
jgi:hypothetical protein